MEKREPKNIKNLADTLKSNEQKSGASVELDKLIQFSEGLDKKNVKCLDYLREISQKNLDKILPDTFDAIAIRFGYFQYSEKEFEDLIQKKGVDREHYRNYGISIIVPSLITNQETFLGAPLTNARLSALARAGKLKDLIKKYMDTIWNNKGKPPEKIKYADQTQTMVEKIRKLANKIDKKLDWAGEPGTRNRQNVIIANLRSFGNREGDFIYSKLTPLFEAGGAANNVHDWYRALAFLTKDIKSDEFAVLVGESLEKEWVHDTARWKKTDNLDLDLVSGDISDATQEWYDDLKNKQ